MPERYPTRESTAYSRLETDQEFRLRILERSRVLDVEYEETLSLMYYGTYKEKRKKSVEVRFLDGEELDDAAWNTLKMQRKIIWVTA